MKPSEAKIKAVNYILVLCLSGSLTVAIILLIRLTMAHYDNILTPSYIFLAATLTAVYSVLNLIATLKELRTKKNSTKLNP
jgi:predicted membrane protein